ncbi:MAG: MBL fold metallo-hydrolase [Phycisphaerae bacterium]
MASSPLNLPVVEHVAVLAVVDNTTERPDLLGEHGLSLWVEADQTRLLLDTGQGEALVHNADRLGLPLAEADAVVLSHGHYDHAGGLPFALDRAEAARVFAHPAALGRRFSRGDAPPHRSIGVPEDAGTALRGQEGRVTWTESPTEIVRGVWVTGEIPRRTDFEDTGGDFYTDPDCLTPDGIPDDQAVFLRTDRGLVVLCGCAHAGLVNTLDYVTDLAGADEVYAVLGGLHLGRASRDRLERTAEAVERYGVQVLGPAHCTGPEAVRFFACRFPDACVGCGAGTWFALT